MATTVTTFAQLQAALLAADQAAANTGAIEIDIQGAIAETADPTAINLASGNTLLINGVADSNGAAGALNGQNAHRGLFVYSGNVTIQNLLIENAVAIGGAGGGVRGGGGAGLGGGLFVAADTADGSAASQVTLSNVSFSGDAAKGGSSGAGSGFGSGGGLGGSGGISYAGGGGIGGAASGGASGSGTGSAGIVPGASGGGKGFNGGNGGANGGGGGGGADAGGGGGIGGQAAPSIGKGGAGGFGGGGGGGTGGGGGGKGGFGGGGGSHGGDSSTTPGGLGGFGAGNGAANGGGGGSGLGAGGDIFVQAGASLVIAGNVSLSGGSVAAGSKGSSSGTAGQAFASGIYLQGNNSLTFNTADASGNATTQTVADVIGNDTGSAAAANYAGVAGYTDGSVGLTKAGAGTLVLSAANTYTGGTTLAAGTLELASASASGGTISGNTKAGGVAFGSGVATLQLDAAALPSGGTYARSISGFSSQDTVDLRGLAYQTDDTVTFSGTTLTVGDSTATDTLSNFSVADQTVVAEAATVLAGATVTGSGGSNGTGALKGDSDPNLQFVVSSDGQGGTNVTASPTNGTVSITSVSFGNGAAQSVVAGSTSTSNPTTVAGTYGTLQIGADGSYGYADTNGLAIVTAADGSPITDTFNDTVTTTEGNSAASSLAITTSLAAGGTETVNNPTGTATYSIGATTLTLTDDAASTYGGVIQDGSSGNKGGNVVVNVAQPLTLSGASTYTGATTISAGTLQGGAANSFSAASAFTDNATLDLDGFNETIGSLAGTGVVTNSGGTAATLTTGGLNASPTFSGTIQDGNATTALTKTGTGTLTLSGNDTFTGGLTVNQGRVVENNTGNALGRGTVAIAAGASVEFATSGNNGYTQAPNTFTGAGTLVKTGTGALTFGGNGGNTYISLSQGGLIDVQAGTLGGSSYGQGIWTNNKASLNLAAGTTFNTVEAAVFVDALTGSGLYTAGYAGTRVTTIGVAGGSGTFSGTLQDNNGAGSLTLIKAGAGTETLAGTSTYAGATAITGGTLEGGKANSFSASSALTANAGTTLDLGGFSETIGSLAGAGTVTNSGSTAATLTTGGLNASPTFSGTIQDGGSALALTKVGTGTLTLSGFNTFTGGTTLSAGTLDLASAGAAGSTVQGNAVAGGVAFASATATLEFDAAALASGGTYAQTISGFALGDVIDLRGLGYRSDMLSTLSGSTLTVGDATASDKLTAFSLANGQNPYFVTYADGNGGTDVRLETRPAAPTGVTVSPASAPYGTQLTITGQGDAAGDTITTYGAEAATPGTTFVLAQTTVAANGSFTAQTAGQVVPDGTFVVTTTDTTAGGTTPSAMSAPVQVVVAANAPTNLTQTNMPVNGGMISVSGNTADAPGDTVEIYATAMTPNAAKMDLGAATVTAGQNGNSFTFTSTQTFADGDYTITATDTSVDKTTSASSTTVAKVLATAPTDLKQTNMPVNGGVISVSGNTTNSAGDKVEIYATAMTPGATAADLGAAKVTAGQNGQPSSFTATSAPGFADGTYTITAIDTSFDGKESASATTVATVAATAPTNLAQTNAPVNGQGVEITGNGDRAGDTITIYDSTTTFNATTQVGTMTEGANGAFDITTSGLADGGHTLTVRNTSADGTQYADATVAATVLPATPTVAEANRPINYGVIEFTGKGGAGDTLNFTIGGAAAPVTNTTGGGAGTVGANGLYDVTTTGFYSDGSYPVSVTETDAAQLTSAAGTITAYVYPAAPVIDTVVQGADMSTSGSTLTVSGTGDSSGDTIKIFETPSAGGPATQIGSGVVDNDGSFSLTTTTPVHDGSYAITATDVDAMNVSSDMSQPVTAKAVPLAPSKLMQDGTSTTGSAGGTATLKIKGAADIGDTVNLYNTDNGGHVLAGTMTNVSSTGLFDITTTAGYGEGRHTFSATQTSADGTTTGLSSATVTAVVIPSAPTGLVQAGMVTYDQADHVGVPVEISGSGDVVGDTINLYANGGAAVVGTGTVTSNGTFDIKTTALYADGKDTFTATDTSADGVVSVMSAPASATVLAPAPSSLAQVGTPANGGTIEIRGIGDATGDTVTVYAATNGAAAQAIGTSKVAGDGSFDLTTMASFADGTYTITAIDTSGDTTVTSATSVASTAVVTSLAPTGLKEVNAPTNGQQIEISGAGDAAGDVITIYDGMTLVGSTTEGNGGAFDTATTKTGGFSDGTHVLTVRNTSADRTQSADAMISATVTATAPTGLKQVGTPTNGQTIEVTGSTTDAVGDTITLSAAMNGGAAAVIGTTTVVAGTNGSNTFDYTSTQTFADGSYSVTAFDTSIDGTQVSAASAATTVDVKLTAPAVTAEKNRPGNNGMIEVTGTAEAGTTVNLYNNGGTTSVGTGTATANGTFDITESVRLPVGKYSVTATSMDAGNEVSAISAPFTAMVYPARPAITSVANGKDMPTTGTTIEVKGTGDKAGDTISLYANNATTAIATGSVANNGTFDIVTPALADGTYSLTATDTDGPSGVVSSLSQAATAKLTPLAPTNLMQSGTTIAGGSVTITGNGDAGDSVNLYANGNTTTVVGTGSVKSDGTFSVTTTTTYASGNDTFTATETSADTTLTSGFSSGAAAMVVPAAPAVVLTSDTGASASDRLTSMAGITVTPAEAGGTLSYVVDGGPAAASYAAPTAQGNHTVAVTQTNAAGNVSAAGSLSFVLDTTPPTLTVAPFTAVIQATSSAGAAVSFPVTAGDAIDGSDPVTYTQAANGTMQAVRSGATFALGTDTIIAVATDQAGNSAAPVAFTFSVVDIAAPSGSGTGTPAVTYNSDGSLHDVDYSGFSGQAYTSYDVAYAAGGIATTASYSDGEVVTYNTNGTTHEVFAPAPAGANYATEDTVYYDNGSPATETFTGVSNPNETPTQITYDPDGTTASATFSNVTGEPYSGYTVALAGGVLKSYTFAGVTSDSQPTQATYNPDGTLSSETFTGVAGDGFTGQTYAFADGVLESRTFTGVSNPNETPTQITYDPDGTTASATFSNVTGEPYSGYTVAFAGGVLKSYTFAGVTSDSQPTQATYNPDGTLSSETFTGVAGDGFTGQTYAFADGVLESRTFTGVSNPNETPTQITYDPDGTTASATFSNVTGEPYSGYTVAFAGGVLKSYTFAGVTSDSQPTQATYNPDGTLSSETFTGVAGDGFTGQTYAFADGVLESRTFTGVSNPNETPTQITYDPDGTTASATFSNVTGEPYSGYTVAFAGGVLKSYTFAGVTSDSQPTQATYNPDGTLSSETFTGVAGDGFTGQTYAFADGVLESRTFTGVSNPNETPTQITYDPDGTTASATFSNVTGEPYSGYTVAFAGGVLKSYTFAGVTSDSQPTQATYNPDGTLSSETFTGLTGKPYTGLVYDFAGGVLQSESFTGVTDPNTTPREIAYAANGNVTSASYAGLTSGSFTVDGSIAPVVQLLSANDYTGGTTLSGGTLELGALNAAGSGEITFAGAATLKIDAAAETMTSATSADFANLIDGANSASQIIDLTSLAFDAGTTTASLFNGTLTVSNGTANAGTDAVTLRVTNANGKVFSTASDGHGGTLVYDPPVTAAASPIDTSWIAASMAEFGGQGTMSSPAPHDPYAAASLAAPVDTHAAALGAAHHA